MNGACGCCAGTSIAVPASLVNPAGLSALTYRVGTYATFLETMLARLSGLTLVVPSIAGTGTDALTPLAALTTRDPADPSIALLDAWATVADVLTFYQERIANEGYLSTARQRRSVLELARLIGNRLRPGVAANVQLAFTVASGFNGTIPAGTRAQSIPGTGQNPQFFETSYALAARDSWNALAPRLTRPQFISPPGERAITGADLIDTVYFEGLATGLNAGNALLFVFGNGTGEQCLRLAQNVDAQASDNRTEVTLAPVPLDFDAETTFAALTSYLRKAEYLFPGSDIAANVAATLTVLRDNWTADTAFDADLLRAALPQIALAQGIATARNFTRVSAFLTQLAQLIGSAISALASPADTEVIVGRGPAPGQSIKAFPTAPAGSPLTNLVSIVDSLALPPSLQPSNSLRLKRSIGQSFAPQSDIAPRLIAALKPAAAPTLYAAWSAIQTPSGGPQILAARTKATLFASAFAGATTVTIAGNGSTKTTTSFTAPTILLAWTSLTEVAALTGEKTAGPLSILPLDSQYDQIVAGSWVVIDRPSLDSSGKLSGSRTPTFHVVTQVRASNMDTTMGFAAKVTLLSLDPPWLHDIAGSQTELDAIVMSTSAVATTVLRDTVVYAQTQALIVAEEPLDTDVEGSSIDLDEVYDGLEPGRWIIVSGTRTDIPGASGVAASELVMIAAVEQGAQAPLCVAFPFAAPPFENVYYTTAADAYGDQLIVGQLTAAANEALQTLTAPAVPNQQYCDQAELAAGVYANAYVPSTTEIAGTFPSFAGLLVDPTTKVPYPSGSIIEQRKLGLFAWRISTATLHTILTLANSLAYSYDRGSVTIYGNVADATHGQTVGEVLGNGDATRAFPSFTLGQSPLTYTSAPTAAGAASTLTVQVNELIWQEVDDFSQATPSERCYTTREDDSQTTTVTFGNGIDGARLPTGTANVQAVFRYGIGSDGNLDAGQISQLATHPLGAAAVINPLPSTGGADADTIDQASGNAPMQVMALDRLVSVQDYADFARVYAGIGKAVAARLSDGRQQVVHVTIAGADDIPIDPNSDLYHNLVQSLQTYGDPYLPIVVAIRRARLLVMSAVVGLLPDYVWEDVVPIVTSVVQALFAFEARALGQTAFLSEAIAAAQSVEGVSYVNVTVFDGVPESITAAALAQLGSTLKLNPYVRAEFAQIDSSAPLGSAQRIVAAELVFMTPDIPDTLILTQGS